jgi:F-type H+-transporting ATPase subunit delta
MSARSVARRYAAALFDVTRKAGSEERAGQDLAELARTVAGHAELQGVLASPTVPASVKKTIVLALLDALGAASDEVRRTVAMLADRDRLAILSDLAAVFGDQLLDAKKIVQADVVTAVPLSAAGRAALTEALGRATGKSVTMTERVDPALVAGVVARVGSVVYDGSVTRQLERLREQLTTNN